jgi:heat shock protein HslJ/uncharacterized lipoprotein NlpE involved in copper resistance
MARKLLATAISILGLAPFPWACRSQDQALETPPQPSVGGALAERSTVFEGVLPIALGEGIHYRLLLRPDSVFYLRQSYLGTDLPDVDELGRWHLDSSPGLVRLASSGEARRVFRVVHSDTLRLLEGFDQTMQPDLDYALVRRESAAPFVPHLPLRGMYTYMADEAQFRECGSQLRFQVALEEEHALLERSYLETVSEPGSPLLAEFVGRIENRPAPAGGGFREVVVVERFEGVWPGESCGAPGASAQLSNTFWGLVRLGAQPVRLEPGQREVHLRLLPERGVVTGFAGCNTLSGSFRVEDHRLRFGALASTRMACPTMELETAFFTRLGEVSQFKVRGDHLDLSDSAGRLLLRFEARYFR